MVSPCGAFLIGKGMMDMLPRVLKEPKWMPRTSGFMVAAIKRYKRNC